MPFTRTGEGLKVLPLEIPNSLPHIRLSGLEEMEASWS